MLSRPRNRYFFVLDTQLLVVSILLAYLLRFDGFDWPAHQREVLVTFLAVAIPLKLFIFYRAGLYRRLWQYASVLELESILIATGLSGLAAFFLGAVLLPFTGLTPGRVPLSILVIDWLLTAAFVALPRLLLRMSRRRRNNHESAEARRVLIAGAGSAGGSIARELMQNPRYGIVPVGFVDDDRTKHGHRMHGLPVMGALSQIKDIVRRERIGEVVIAMPSASGTVVRQVVRAAAEADIKTRTMPSIFDLISGRVQATALRQVEIQDLLRREPVQTNLDEVRGLATGKPVLVTGAGGSIGSELCRQMARLKPARLVLLGHGENSIFEIRQELIELFPEVPLESVIMDVRDREGMERVFDRYEPYSVFHAAAHKHVPLMEANIGEAVTNNVLGTKNVVELAAAAEVEYLVLISTDKAVHPTSIMGATKRVAEQIVQDTAETTGRNFVSVRFGNVLGSRGSAVPIFLRQIAAGGPVTVTHPEMRRYFMTIPEAVQLVLQAGAIGKGGEVFVLDMGEPVKVLDLATDLIRLSGFEVGRDIEIRFSGARPGEKLYEELFFSAESAEPTGHAKILRAKNAVLPPGVGPLTNDLIVAALERWADDDLREFLRRLVPDFEPTLAGAPVRVEGREALGREGKPPA
jgi:FlaA1/EpsC-like NDP-sugar epimerase